MLTGGDTASKNKAYVRRSDMKEEQYGYYSDSSYSDMNVNLRPSRATLIDE